MGQNRIKALRKTTGYSQKELAEELGVGQTTVSAWETGRNEPDNKSAYKMTKLFGCSIGYLMGYEPESPYRGLTEEEWFAFNREKWSKREAEKWLDADNAAGEAAIEEWEQSQWYRSWEETGRAAFPETIEIDALLEQTDQDGRKRILEMVELVLKIKHD